MVDQSVAGAKLDRAQHLRCVDFLGLVRKVPRRASCIGLRNRPRFEQGRDPPVDRPAAPAAINRLGRTARGAVKALGGLVAPLQHMFGQDADRDICYNHAVSPADLDAEAHDSSSLPSGYSGRLRRHAAATHRLVFGAWPGHAAAFRGSATARRRE